MNEPVQFEHWRHVKRPQQSWGLAWYLSHEVCRRFYSSHGLVPWVIDHEGLGYYGITINLLPCPVNPKEAEAIGRITINGNAENWRRGGPGDHGCKLIELCAAGSSAEELVRAAISHLELSALPAESHLSCRHKRWGDSYELCFEIATIIALQSEPEDMGIWNHPVHTRRAIEQLDPESGMKEHPGAFLFVRGEREVCLSGDGRLLEERDQNFWVQYMSGASPYGLAKQILGRLDA
jgi:hypothetical protein